MEQSKLIISNETLLKNLQRLKNDLVELKKNWGQTEADFIRFKISIEIIDKLEKYVKELNADNSDLQKHIATIRYALETLIVTQLLVKEKEYFLKLYFSIFDVQQKKIKEMVLRIQNEINILKEYYEKYNFELSCGKFENEEEIFQIYKNKVQNYINIYFDKLEDYGFEFLIPLLEDQVLRAYEEKLKEIDNLKEKRAIGLADKEWFQQYFHKNIEISEVFKLLKDKRTWKEKAVAADLEHEYKITYEITSSLLHFTSYSLLTSNEIDNEEINLNYMILNQYLKKIIENLGIFHNVKLLQKFTILKTSDFVEG